MAGECSPGPLVALGVGGGRLKPRSGSSMGARKGNRHPGCQGSAPALEVSCGQIPWRDAEAASLQGHSEWLPAPSQ